MSHGSTVMQFGCTLELKQGSNHTCKKRTQLKCQNANANIYQGLRGGAVQTVVGVCKVKKKIMHSLWVSEVHMCEQ